MQAAGLREEDKLDTAAHQTMQHGGDRMDVGADHDDMLIWPGMMIPFEIATATTVQKQQTHVVLGVQSATVIGISAFPKSGCNTTCQVHSHFFLSKFQSATVMFSPLVAPAPVVFIAFQLNTRGKGFKHAAHTTWIQ